MKRIGILSFHGAHNYGSMLQNYALQQAIASISEDFEPITINLRNNTQDDMYNIFKPYKDYVDKRRYLFKILMYPWRKSLISKHSLFESFLNEKINLSPRIASSEEIKSLPVLDAYIVGSDQIWNFNAQDFDSAYFLDFLEKKDDPLKIAYAPSMGPDPSCSSLTSESQEKYRNLIAGFNSISVREKKTADEITKLGHLMEKPVICPDPTLLLNKQNWLNLIQDMPPVREGKYIFLYNPYYLKEVYNQANELSKITGLPVIVSNLSPKTIIPSIAFEKRLETGPVEFLNLVNNAEYVIGRSFHLAVFSMIFNKKFIAVNGMGDSRLGDFLTEIGMMECATYDNNLHQVIEKVKICDFNDCNHKLDELRSKGYDFLTDSLKSLRS